MFPIHPSRSRVVPKHSPDLRETFSTVLHPRLIWIGNILEGIFFLTFLTFFSSIFEAILAWFWRFAHMKRWKNQFFSKLSVISQIHMTKSWIWPHNLLPWSRLAQKSKLKNKSAFSWTPQTRFSNLWGSQPSKNGLSDQNFDTFDIFWEFFSGGVRRSKKIP